jgi:hypothetical protein
VYNFAKRSLVNILKLLKPEFAAVTCRKVLLTSRELILTAAPLNDGLAVRDAIKSIRLELATVTDGRFSSFKPFE